MRGVGRRDQRRRVKDRSDPNDVRGVVRVGFELGGDRHQCHVASVMGVTEPDDRVEPEPGPVGVGDLDPRSEHLDQRAAAKDRVRRVEQRRRPGSGGLRHVQRGEEHAVDQHHVSGLTLEFGSDVAGDLGAEAQILDEEPHFGTGVPGRRRRVPPPVLREGAKSRPAGREQLAGRVVAQHARTSWPATTRARQMPNVGTRLPEPAQLTIRYRLMSRLQLPRQYLTGCKVRLGLQHVK